MFRKVLHCAERSTATGTACEAQVKFALGLATDRMWRIFVCMVTTALSCVLDPSFHFNLWLKV